MSLCLLSDEPPVLTKSAKASVALMCISLVLVFLLCFGFSWRRRDGESETWPVFDTFVTSSVLKGQVNQKIHFIFIHSFPCLPKARGSFIVHKTVLRSPSTSVVQVNATTLFCCEAPKMFFRHFWVSLSFKCLFGAIE